MCQLIFNPATSGSRMTIACFISGSGTNYERIFEKDPSHRYIVFTNRPGCEGANKARQNKHTLIELDHLPFLASARERYRPGSVPRNCPEREAFEQEASRLIEKAAGRQPDLICLAGYDQWVTDWMVDRYYPRMLNVHPGDTTRGYDGLHWVPTARAILAGDDSLKSTLFIVDKGEDTGPVLAQSEPMHIQKTLEEIESMGAGGMVSDLCEVTGFARSHDITTYKGFKATAGTVYREKMQRICESLQNQLKYRGDWKIYPFGVHNLIARGRVAIDGRTLFVDGAALPAGGYQVGKEE
ncbi:MAG: hypothetical protein JW954_05505 [Dehalococcoidaceae bacterium]|nr:hypothetical protein [Dehalococcoidaceae bacterium]